MRLLGVDLGDKRTGLALADRELDVISPIAQIEIPLARESELIERIGAAAREHEAGTIVIGLPLNMDGSEGPRARLVREFAERNARRFEGAVVELFDERLSSDAADEAMAGSGLTHKQKKARRDALAACAILRGYLESLRSD